MSSYRPRGREVWNPHEYRTNDRADRRHDKWGVGRDKPIPPPPPPPVIEDTEGRRQDEADRLRRRRGRASAIMYGGRNTGAPQTASQALLGS